MLFLLLPLLAALFLGGDSGLQELVSYHLMQTSSFHNHSWVHLGSGWLGELQTHRWNSSSNTIIYLYPWSRGNFSNNELMDLEKFFHVYFSDHQEFYIFQLMFKDPFDLQVTAVCELHSGKSWVGFVRVAIQGYDFLSFQNETWSPSPKGGRKAQKACEILNVNQAYTNRIHTLLTDTFPRFTLGLLDAGKAHLQQQVKFRIKRDEESEWHLQKGEVYIHVVSSGVLNLSVYVTVCVWMCFLSFAVKPEAWLSSGLSPEPGHVLLVCHVSGFYPKPVWVMWMRGEQEQLGTQRGDILPNADGTWYLRATLDVAAGEAAGLACRVKHSSLGGQDLVLYWGAPPSALGWILLAVIVALALLAGLGFWFMKHWTQCEAPCSALSLK
ncbi:T-cell surface glycoprotein CD1a-like [Marmota marmota marmota]|uniref:T-cell surface glycoprotein CD1a-like n=1 Tax=Marmota marmota marmota TaxID=9994 RepID=UPI0020928151|nr:T-cell surface glycoprotein CD1a-like [Marmota marmota marmota]